MELLIEFLLRLTFGLALGMALTSPQLVTSGYYRNHLYVTLGLACLAALLSQSASSLAFWPAVGAAVLSYVGSVCWLYEKSLVGRLFLGLVSIAGVVGLLLTRDTSEGLSGFADTLRWVAPICSGLLLGVTMASMLLGHWYLNSPGMQLAPLRRLIVVIGFAVALQIFVAGFGLWWEISGSPQVSLQWTLFVLLRWSFGLLGVGITAWMAWQTLKIPNTQSATGILYVAVIGTFVGETMSMLLSSESVYPL